MMDDYQHIGKIDFSYKKDRFSPRYEGFLGRGKIIDEKKSISLSDVVLVKNPIVRRFLISLHTPMRR